MTTYCPCGNELTGRGVIYCSTQCAIDAYAPPPRRHRTHATTTKQRGYDHAWRTLAATILQRDYHSCHVPIDQDGNVDESSVFLCNVYADTVDHVIEFTDIDDPLRLDPDNLRAACRRHNSQRAARNTNAKRKARQ